MPTHCCVPGCTKKGYREEHGSKVSYFQFPREKIVKKKWIQAIRRDEGKDFKISDSTKVCSRHFRNEDLKKTLAGKICLKPGAIPSIFSWIRTSPRKRKPPTERNVCEPVASIAAVSRSNASAESVVEFDLEEKVEVSIGLTTSVVENQNIILPEKECYDLTETITNKNKRIEELEQEINDIKLRLENAQRQITNLTKKQFVLENLKAKKNTAAFYTGFNNWDAFEAVYNYLDPGERGGNIAYWRSGNGEVPVDYDQDQSEDSFTKKGRARSLRPMDEFFLVMCRLRQGFHEDHLAHLFNVSTPTVSRIVITWINFMYFKFGHINIWPSREVIDRTMPEAFKNKYGSTRVIIDCTEVRCQMPSSLQLNGALFSSYKHHTTLKGLVGISPGGAITFISQLYTGSISDREIVRRSGLLDLPFKDKDSIMADKGFTISDLLPLGVSLNLPPFLGGSNQMPAEDVVQTQEIASLRIHIERAINKIKNFHIWDRVVPLHQIGVVNQMWAVCAFLCNAQPNIISV